jgi:hypothetical protein
VSPRQADIEFLARIKRAEQAGNAAALESWLRIETKMAEHYCARDWRVIALQRALARVARAAQVPA